MDFSLLFSHSSPLTRRSSLSDFTHTAAAAKTRFYATVDNQNDTLPWTLQECQFFCLFSSPARSKSNFNTKIEFSVIRIDIFSFSWLTSEESFEVIAKRRCLERDGEKRWNCAIKKFIEYKLLLI